jgi:hypothetical protein
MFRVTDQRRVNQSSGSEVSTGRAACSSRFYLSAAFRVAANWPSSSHLALRRYAQRFIVVLRIQDGSKDKGCEPCGPEFKFSVSWRRWPVSVRLATQHVLKLCPERLFL